MESDYNSNWEDAIDVDDSDLPSIHSLPTNYKTTLPPLRPCSQTSNSGNPYLSNPNSDIPSNSKSNSPIPGPAGAVQAAMNRRSHIKSPILSSTSEVVFEDDDGEFKLNPWLNATDFLGREFEKTTPFGSVRMKNVAEKINQVVGVVKSCVPNGLGDLFITLKDPTGIISASIHRNVIKECNPGGDITVGSVVILKQVVVFCPSRSTCYLNVTKNNIVKVFSKDSDRQDRMPSSKARYVETGKQMKERPALRVNMEARGEAEEFVAGNEVRRDTTNTQYNASQIIATKLDRGTTFTNCMVNKSSSLSKTTGSIAGESSPRKVVETGTGMEDPKKLISSISNAEWTDEQLLELDCQYDMMF